MPIRTTSSWVCTLPERTPSRKSSRLSSASGLNGAEPTAATTASTRADRREQRRDRARVGGVDRGPPLRDASTTSCPRASQRVDGGAADRPVPDDQDLHDVSFLPCRRSRSRRSARPRWSTVCSTRTPPRRRAGRRLSRASTSSRVHAVRPLRVGPGGLVLGQRDRHVRLDHRPELGQHDVLRRGPDAAVEGEVRVVPDHRVGGRRRSPRTPPGPRAPRPSGARSGRRGCRGARAGRGPPGSGRGRGARLASRSATRSPRYGSATTRPSWASWPSASRTVARLTCKDAASDDLGQLVARPQRAGDDAPPDLGHDPFPAGDRGHRQQDSRRLRHPALRLMMGKLACRLSDNRHAVPPLRDPTID